jgi:hypothetical protein
LVECSHEIKIVANVAILFMALSQDAEYDAFTHAYKMCRGVWDVEEEVH